MRANAQHTRRDRCIIPTYISIYKIINLIKKYIIIRTRALQTDKHDHVLLPLLWLKRLRLRVHKLAQLLENCLLNDPPLVQASSLQIKRGREGGWK